jgi:hypothetical protein
MPTPAAGRDREYPLQDKDETMSTNGSKSAYVADKREIGVPLRGGADDPNPAKDGAVVDLAAWGRGERNYPWAEVQNAIDDYALAEIEKIIQARFAGVTDRAAAVDFLIEENIIRSEEARRDV